ncbi:MAG: class I SAM-dependent methyltransferase, partial [Aestuariibacter sp.]|nr:class I SAM-dependent methyltransferase [Aestuariibacter sp.]
MANSTERFSDRVDNYIKYRPSYPDAVIDTLVSQCKLTPQSIVADVGSGTGIFSGLLLKHNIQVMAVEPNDSMRKAAENLLASSTGFSSIAGQSEQTNLADASVDLITAAQAFHWFDRELTQREFSRILKPAGHVALIWNQRKSNTPFLKEYDDMLSVYATDYNSVNHMNIADTDIEEFYGSRQLSIFDFDN